MAVLGTVNSTRDSENSNLYTQRRERERDASTSQELGNFTQRISNSHIDQLSQIHGITTIFVGKDSSTSIRTKTQNLETNRI